MARVGSLLRWYYLCYCTAVVCTVQARLVIPCRSELPFLILHVKDLGKFASIEVAVVDDTRRVRRITFSSKVRLCFNHCSCIYSAIL